MRRAILNRYERDLNGNILFDVAAGGVEDLYSNFDRQAPYIRRDLDPDLAEYLIECAREVDRLPFRIRFRLDRTPDDSKQERIRRSVAVYFQYLVETERQMIRQMFRRSFLLACIGVVILFIAVWVNQSLVSDESVVGKVFAEGLTVAAWVSLWEAVAVFLIEWFPHRKEIKTYQRLSRAELVFHAVHEPDRPAAMPPDAGNGVDVIVAAASPTVTRSVQ